MIKLAYVYVCVFTPVSPGDGMSPSLRNETTLTVPTGRVMDNVWTWVRPSDQVPLCYPLLTSGELPTPCLPLRS